MKLPISKPKKGVTLIELTVVIAILLALVGATLLSVKTYQDWQAGLDAGENLKKVYAAQKLYLAENPTKAPSDIEEADIIKNMPDGATALPTVKGLDGETLTINYKSNTSPPVYENGGATYDPSGSPTDNLWDTGK